MLAAAVTLSAVLLAWKADIESRGVAVVVAELEKSGGALSAAADTPHLDLLRPYLESAEFQQQFALMHASMVFQRAPGREVAFVLLNGERRAEWESWQEALLAHELGHAWIKAQKYPTPVFVPGPHACLAIHTGDIVQHVLIRREMERRGIDYRKSWLQRLEQAIPVMQTSAPPPEEDRCARARLAAEWVDVKLGLQPGEWPAEAAYEAAVRRYMPEVVSTVERITDYVRRSDLSDRDQHREALKAVFEMLKDLVYHRAREFRVYGTLKKKRAAA
ncbi:MAG: hypothetical protein KatS3mg005_0920 [Bryobacteraceae bacterium]|nr:MAG: hypothetical protein KatS3mg005_0920 [Bryobacteraceae bacterium]